MSENPLKYRASQNGRFIKEDGTTANVADMMEDSKATGAVVVTPNDTTVISVTSGLYLGTSGDVAVTMKDGSNVTFKSLAAGVIHPICITKVKATGTTATNILAVY